MRAPRPASEGSRFSRRARGDRGRIARAAAREQRSHVSMRRRGPEPCRLRRARSAFRRARPPGNSRGAARTAPRLHGARIPRGGHRVAIACKRQGRPQAPALTRIPIDRRLHRVPLPPATPLEAGNSRRVGQHLSRIAGRSRAEFLCRSRRTFAAGRADDGTPARSYGHSISQCATFIHFRPCASVARQVAQRNPAQLNLDRCGRRRDTNDRAASEPSVGALLQGMIFASGGSCRAPLGRGSDSDRCPPARQRLACCDSLARHVCHAGVLACNAGAEHRRQMADHRTLPRWRLPALERVLFPLVGGGAAASHERRRDSRGHSADESLLSSDGREGGTRLRPRHCPLLQLRSRSNR